MSQEPPTTTKSDSEPINIKVVTSQGDEVFFKIKTNTKLTKLRSAYATKVGKDLTSIRFLYDGNRITDDDTPASLGMEDNDSIDVMVERRWTLETPMSYDNDEPQFTPACGALDYAIAYCCLPREDS